IDTFKFLSDKIGKEKVVWRFDPLVLTKDLDVNNLIDKIEKIGNKIHKYTEKLIFSYADIKIYNKVLNNLRREKINYLEFTKEKMIVFAKSLSELNKKWGLDLATCCEDIELQEFGIKHNKCIDDDLIIRLFNKDRILMDFLDVDVNEQVNLFENTNYHKRPYLKDKGQRKVCGCIMSKDIGEYNTCNHLCVYCYANTSEKMVKDNIKKHSFKKEGIV
ncbi:MAG: DUF1848 family protein, partial [Ignavibacteria bacterium]